MPCSRYEKCDATNGQTMHNSDGTGHCQYCGCYIYDEQHGGRKTKIKLRKTRKTRKTRKSRKSRSKKSAGSSR